MDAEPQCAAGIRSTEALIGFSLSKVQNKQTKSKRFLCPKDADGYWRQRLSHCMSDVNQLKLHFMR